MTVLNSRLVAAIALVSMSGLAACAMPARPVRMAAPLAPPMAVSQGDVGYRSVTNVHVIGGQTTNPLWASKVSNEGFQAALQTSLGQAGYLGAEGRQMTVSAHIAPLDQPLVGTDMWVTSRVRYTVTQQGWPVFDETITTSGAASLFSHLYGPERLRKANEAAMQESIRLFMQRFRVHAITQGPA